MAVALGLSEHCCVWMLCLVWVSELCPRLEQAGEGAARGSVPQGMDTALHGVCKCSLLLNFSSSLSRRVQARSSGPAGFGPDSARGVVRGAPAWATPPILPPALTVSNAPSCCLLDIFRIQLNTSRIHPSLGRCLKTMWVRLNIQALF